VNPLLFISALILGPLFGLLAGVAIGLWWANRPANDSKSEARERFWREVHDATPPHSGETFDEWARRNDR
jgi:hypothetical protein